MVRDEALPIRAGHVHVVDSPSLQRFSAKFCMAGTPGFASSAKDTLMFSSVTSSMGLSVRPSI